MPTQLKGSGATDSGPRRHVSRKSDSGRTSQARPWPDVHAGGSRSASPARSFRVCPRSRLTQTQTVGASLFRAVPPSRDTPALCVHQDGDGKRTWSVGQSLHAALTLSRRRPGDPSVFVLREDVGPHGAHPISCHGLAPRVELTKPLPKGETPLPIRPRCELLVLVN